ncbi:MAG: helix-turn-helix domain-containing protein [Desulfomonilaceae bacterium]
MVQNELTKAEQAQEEPLCPLMNVVDVADILGVAHKTVNKLVRSGKLGCVQISPRARRFSKEQVKAYIDSKKAEVPIDRKRFKPVKSRPPKGGEKSFGFSRTSLREEMRSWR